MSTPLRSTSTRRLAQIGHRIGSRSTASLHAPGVPDATEAARWPSARPLPDVRGDRPPPSARPENDVDAVTREQVGEPWPAVAVTVGGAHTSRRNIDGDLAVGNGDKTIRAFDANGDRAGRLVEFDERAGEPVAPGPAHTGLFRGPRGRSVRVVMGKTGHVNLRGRGDGPRRFLHPRWAADTGLAWRPAVLTMSAVGILPFDAHTVARRCGRPGSL